MPSRSPRSSSARSCCASGPAPRPGRPARRGPGTRSPGEGGFSLLEVIVALAILGIGLAVIMQGLSQGLRLRGQSAENIRFALAAERALDLLLARKNAPEQPLEGEEGGYTWRVEPVRKLGGETPSSGELVEVRLAIRSPAGNEWQLATLLPAK